MEEQLGLTALFNQYLAGVGNSILNLVHLTAKDPQHPWENWIVMELLVVALLMITVAIVRAGLSVENPGKLQHVFEMIRDFLKTSAEEAGVHHADEYLPYFGTLFIFILSMNLIGMIPAFESPTQSPWVPAGLAIVTFLYYNMKGFKANGIGYLKHFMGPVLWLAPLMVVIELMSHFIRPLSLTVRLFGNMFAGEQITNVFLTMPVPVWAAPLSKLIGVLISLGLHVFVALVQAYVFTLLTIIYVAGATEHGHDEELAH
jgi:F-type H+-transporting ATPase subunit a